MTFTGTTTGWQLRSFFVEMRMGSGGDPLGQTGRVVRHLKRVCSHDTEDRFYLSGGNTIGSGSCDAGQGRLYFAAISETTRSQRSFPKLL